MKNIISIILFSTLGFAAIGQHCPIITLENSTIQENDIYFDVLITNHPESSTDLYLGNSDFTISINKENFIDPEVVAMEHSCTFIPEIQSESNIRLVRTIYELNTTVSFVAEDIIMINLSGPNVTTKHAFDQAVAKIDQHSKHRLATFKLSGFTGTNIGEANLFIGSTVFPNPSIIHIVNANHSFQEKKIKPCNPEINTNEIAANSGVEANQISQLDDKSLLNPNCLVCYPNPTEGELTIRNLEPNTRLLITSLAGKIMLDQIITATTLSIDIRHWGTGVYVVKTRRGTQQIVKL